jgi:hypothetical protein
MTTQQDFLDRMAPLVPRPERPLEGFHRRRLRKRRNERIRAGALGLALMVAGALVAANAIRSEQQTGEPSPSPSLLGGLPRGTFADVRGWIVFRDGNWLVAVDPDDPEERLALGGISPGSRSGGRPTASGCFSGSEGCSPRGRST